MVPKGGARALEGIIGHRQIAKVAACHPEAQPHMQTECCCWRTESLVASSVACACCWGLVLHEQGRSGQHSTAGLGVASERWGGCYTGKSLPSELSSMGRSRASVALKLVARGEAAGHTGGRGAQRGTLRAAAGGVRQRRTQSAAGEQAGVHAQLVDVLQAPAVSVQQQHRHRPVVWVGAAGWAPVTGPSPHLQGLGQVANCTERHGDSRQDARGVQGAKKAADNKGAACVLGFRAGAAAACAAAPAWAALPVHPTA